MTPEHTNPFRSFALAVYADEKMESACLDLQRHCDADVLIVLLCAWLGRHGVKLSRDAIEEVDRAAAPWRSDVIAPIRAIRTRMKLPVGEVTVDQAADIRNMIKAAELEAELLQIDVLYAMMEELPGQDGRDADRAGLIRGNVVRYLGLKRITGSDVPRGSVETIVSVCLGDAETEEQE